LFGSIFFGSEKARCPLTAARRTLHLPSMIEHALFLMLAAAAPVNAQPTAPAGKWVVDFADAQCVASRDYGSGDDKLTFLLKPSPLGNVMQIGLLRSGKKAVAEQVPAWLTPDEGKPISTSALVFGSKTAGNQIMHRINLPWQDYALLREASRVTLDVKGQPQVSLQLAQMKELSKAIDVCLQDLQEVWNVGTTRAARLRQDAKTHRSLKSMFSSDDYPDIALLEEQGGQLSFVLLIDEKGSVVNCTVDQTSGYASLDAQSCSVIKTRARFSPAIDAQGKPAKTGATGRVRWLISPPVSRTGGSDLSGADKLRRSTDRGEGSE
jgi:hypothetical protein